MWTQFWEILQKFLARGRYFSHYGTDSREKEAVCPLRRIQGTIQCTL